MAKVWLKSVTLAADSTRRETYYMSAIRQMLISTIALAVIGPVSLRGAEIAEYVGGTVKSIPINSTGSLSELVMS